MAQSTHRAMLCWLVYLTTHEVGRLVPLRGLPVLPVLCIYFGQKVTTALLESVNGENDHRKYFMINLHEKIC